MSHTLHSGIPTLDDGTGEGVKLALAKWFTLDITDPFLPAGMSRKVIIHFAINTSSRVEYTLNNSDWVAFNNGNPIGPDIGFQLDFMSRTGDIINIRATNALTVIFARVDTVPWNGIL